GSGCPCHQHTPSAAHPEVLGVHVQLLAVQLGQLGEGRLEVFQVLDGIPEGGEHFLAVGADLGVADDGGGAGEVPKVIEEPLGPGVDDQQPGERQRDTSRHTDTLILPNAIATVSLSRLQPSRCPGAGPTWPGPRHRIPPR
uniref:Uncharacterized protein n=1 Tax=Otus sunia TaxID=257818 RepID=A0A8C8B6G2_9STRI